MGEIIRVYKDSAFPADILLLRSEGVDGYCYVETKSLDGETNLKLKLAPPELNDKYIHQSKKDVFENMNVTVEGDPPNANLYSYSGTWKENGQEPLKLNVDNCCWRGMTLRNTESVVGLVVYTGHDTTIQMNNSKARYKMSKIMKSTGMKIWQIFTLQFIIALTAAVIGTMMNDTKKVGWNRDYLHHRQTEE